MPKQTKQSDLNDEISVKIEPKDYSSIIYHIDEDGKELIPNFTLRLPRSVSTTLKGDFGEYIAKTILDLKSSFKDPETILELQKRGYKFDLLNPDNTKTYDVKLSPEQKCGYNRTTWKFYLSSGRPFKGAIKISDRKYKKNYREVGIDFLICIGIFDDPKKQPQVFIIPTDSPEVMNNLNITIPTSGRTKYNKYRFDYNKCEIT
ncbi:MAG: hypothetical protein AAGU27_16225 [Dehalobacterium sp.]